MSRAAGHAHHAAQTFLNQRECVALHLHRGRPASAIRDYLARIQDDPSDHMRLGESARCDRAVRVGKLQQIDFRRPQGRGGVSVQPRPYPQIARRLQDAGNADLPGDPNRNGVSGFGQRHPERDHALELAIVIRDPFRILLCSIGDADGFVGHRGVEIECPGPKSSQIDDGFHGGPRLPQRLRHAVEIAVCARASFVGLAAARLGEDTRIAVSQHHHRALHQASGTRVPVLVQQEPVLQRLVRDFLHPGVHRRVDLDMSLQQFLFVEIRAAAFEFFQNILNHRGRPDRLVLALRGRFDRAVAGAPGAVRGNEPPRRHQR